MVHSLVVLSLVLIVSLEGCGAMEPCVAKFEENSFGVGFANETYSKTTFCTYLGVRYAEPPTGSLRFRNPVLHNPVGPQSYTVEGSICPQEDDIYNFSEFIGAEDCLFMNIYSPLVRADAAEQNETKYPVLVFVHGGSFIVGSAHMNVEYGVDALIDNGILVVSINYRLHALGFLRHPEFNVTGNYGLKDQRAALQWIQKYIKFFGGDPQRVTLMGHSAGAGSVAYHLYSDGSRGLFQQVFILGGSFLAPWALNYDPPTTSQKLLSALNISTAEELQDIDYKEFFSDTAADTLAFFTMFYPGFVPSLEDPDDQDAFITVPPYERVVDAPPLDVPILVEHTATEFELLLFYADFFYMGSNFPNSSSPSTIKTITHLVALKSLLSRDPNFYRKFANMANLYYPTKLFLRYLCQYNIAPIYYMQFEFDGQFGFYKHEYYKTRTNGSRYGPVHGDELGYIFSPYIVQEALDNRTKFRQEWKVHEQTAEVISNFVKYGNPTPKKSKLSNVVWPAYNDKSSLDKRRHYLSANQTFEVRVDNDSEHDLFNFWESIYECLYYTKCDNVKIQLVELQREIKLKTVDAIQDENLINGE